MKTNNGSVKQAYKFDIFGDQYSLVSDETREFVEAAAQAVDILMKELAQKTGLKDHKKIAVLAALQFSSKIAELESQLRMHDTQSAHLSETIDRIIFSCKNAG